MVALIATLALVVALALIPAGIAASHGPGAYAASRSADASQGHVHTWEPADAAQHDATDHEHQTAAILPGTGNTVGDACTVALHGFLSTAIETDREGRRARR